MDQRAVVAVDIGGTAVKAALVSAELVALRELRRPSERAGGAVALAPVAAMITELAADAEVVGVGVVVPGIVDDAAGVVRAAVNLGWVDLPLRAELAAAVGLPLRVGHDVRAGGLAEFTVGAAAGVANAFFTAIGTGIAAAAKVDGHLLAGGGYAGEFGHIVVDQAGDVCGCGTVGCLETLAAAPALPRRYRALTGVERTAQEIAGLVGADPAATLVWEDAVRALGTALHTAVTLFGPEVVVLGGGLSEAGAALVDPVAADLDRRLSFQRRPRVVRAALGQQAGRAGAALMAWEAAGITPAAAL
ncbi:ROK family protein [Actinokineospora bangkokensis]|uniref:Sugar kinase n=1 Tax=Actinokineospora bangkokensis TaxID=1193682 RepID=A0A1Q9LPP5_9PSEU|nr:ROK family protein [Actinokineospora bangkokensis]OLR94016.1 sugar kinase [Actinokineospora bangkokensis]